VKHCRLKIPIKADNYETLYVMFSTHGQLLDMFATTLSQLCNAYDTECNAYMSYRNAAVNQLINVYKFV